MKEKKYKMPDDGSLAYLFFHTVTTVRKHAYGSYSQQRVLTLLEENGPMSQKEMLELLEIQAGSLSEICAKLEDKGLIVRNRSEKDRRVLVLKISEKGKEKRKEISLHKDEKIFEALSKEERDVFRKLLEKLNTSETKEISI